MQINFSPSICQYLPREEKSNAATPEKGMDKANPRPVTMKSEAKAGIFVFPDNESMNRRLRFPTTPSKWFPNIKTMEKMQKNIIKNTMISSLWDVDE